MFSIKRRFQRCKGKGKARRKRKGKGDVKGREGKREGGRTIALTPPVANSWLRHWLCTRAFAIDAAKAKANEMKSAGEHILLSMFARSRID